MNILLILHTYAADRRFGSFALELIKGFRQTGANVYVIKTNDLVDNLAHKRFSKKLDKHKVKEIFKEKKFDLVFTTNHGGIGGIIRRLTKHTPVISWMVDRNPFEHDGYLSMRLFHRNDKVITSSSANVPSLREKFHLSNNQVFFFPFMTNPDSFTDGLEKDINISFVGSYFMNERVVSNALKKLYGTEQYEDLLAFIKDLEDDFDLNEYDLFKKYKLKKIVRYKKQAMRRFKGAVGNMISNRKRIEYLSAVADMGLSLYGTKNLSELINIAPRVAACYHPNYFVNTRERLVNIYDRSKIGLNINHHQATTGLGYRVFDIMYSSALLVSNYQRESDMELLFGKDHPVPIYRNAGELREICAYYLEHEKERQEITRQCRALIGDRHTFKTRAREIVQLAYPDFRPSGASGDFKQYGPMDLWTDDAINQMTFM